ncbi:hypothetical protein GH714_035395 [Hevea brasiliensis]|uniref:Uncharacterized protein n=1 Tax=Hevea brasiliensis TaxID=3981 RepID=A0A6A6L5P6_HEVBR|nr:hypothetical protein GH714_035395 [Hevea brasiliensis]
MKKLELSERDGLEEGISGINGWAWFEDSGSLGAWGNDFDEIEGLGVGLEEYAASLDGDCGSHEEDASGIWEDIGTILCDTLGSHEVFT